MPLKPHASRGHGFLLPPHFHAPSSGAFPGPLTGAPPTFRLPSNYTLEGGFCLQKSFSICAYSCSYNSVTHVCRSISNFVRVNGLFGCLCCFQALHGAVVLPAKLARWVRQDAILRTLSPGTRRSCSQQGSERRSDMG